MLLQFLSVKHFKQRISSCDTDIYKISMLEMTHVVGCFGLLFSLVVAQRY